MNFRTVGAAGAVVVACAFGTAVAAAQQGSGGELVLAARTLGYEGIEAFQAGNYVLADQKLNRAYQLLPVPSLGLWSARALVKLNFLVQASQRYTEVGQSRLLAGDSGVQRQAQLEAQSELAALLPSIPRMSLQLEGAVWNDVAVTLDAMPVSGAARQAPILVNPGERQIEGRRGPERVLVRISMARSEQKVVVLAFSTPSESARPESRSERDATWRTVGWVTVGVGGTALLMSGVAGLVAWKQTDDFDCRRDPCTTADANALDTYHSLVTASTIGYVAGGLVAAGGALLLLKYGAADAGVIVGIGPSSATLSGCF